MRAGDAKPDVNGDNTMTLIERLENVIKYGHRGNDPEWSRFVSNALLCAVRDALQQPIMPEQPTDDLLSIIAEGYTSNLGDYTNKSHRFPYSEKAYHALRAALSTPPKPKMKTVWHAAYTFNKTNWISVHETKEEAERLMKGRKNNDAYTNISPVWSEEVEDK
jgi:hypothetical protein